VDKWIAPIKKNPFDVSVDEKVNFLFNINEKAKSLGPIIALPSYGQSMSGNILLLRQALTLNRK